MDLRKNNIGLGNKTALVLVDMINAFTDTNCELGLECPDVVAANLELLKVFRKNQWPIVFTTVAYENEQQARVFRQRLPALNALQVGSHWVEIDARLAPQDDEALIVKQFPSAFFSTVLDQKLRTLKIDSIVVTGLTTSGCVRATAVDGLQHNYRVVVARDAVGDRNQAAHEANLFDLNAKYADVLGNSEIKKLLA